MIHVTVRTIALLKTLLGRDEIDIALPDGADVDSLFHRLGELGDERLAPYVAVPERDDALLPLRVLVNGQDISRLNGRRTALSDGDEVLVFMPLAGG